jgi:UDP-2-acetamido-2,6-beta-L-arabino-hexul-4-ose reductase
MKVLITGSEGFIGTNLKFFLQTKNIDIINFNKKSNFKKEFSKIQSEDTIIHVAGENRAKKQFFYLNNVSLTKKICDFFYKKKIKPRIIYISSIHVTKNNDYGITKKKAEKILKNFRFRNGSIVNILRLPNVFGKWSKPNYNSVVATFCYNIINKKKIFINPSGKKVNLIYIDDVLEQIYKVLQKRSSLLFVKVIKVYKIQVKNLAKIILNFQKFRTTNNISFLKSSFNKKLYSTFLSFLPHDLITYPLSNNFDARGNFIEFIKSSKFGQISIFTINVKKERGNHYHNSKIEKFFLIQGRVKFFFTNIYDGKKFNYSISSNDNRIIETIPGFAHKIKNIGKNKAIFLVWANEIFDKTKLDTYKYLV